MKKLHISFKLAIAALLMCFIVGLGFFMQLTRTYNLVGSSDGLSTGDAVLVDVFSKVHILTYLLVALLVMYVGCLIWGIIHEIKST
jgi:hypothetical protein